MIIFFRSFLGISLEMLSDLISESFLGLRNSEHIARIRIHPTDPDIVYVAAIGNLWKPNEERGVFKTTDGGKSWEPMRVIMDMGNDPKWRYDGIGDPAILVDRNTGTITV